MITAAADGSALSNPGPTGWAWYVDDDRWAAGGWDHGTNNMGELMAVLDLLRQTAQLDEPLHVLCDSQYAINCISKWTPGWKRRGWKKADGKPVLNVELLKQLDAAMAGRQVSFEWVKGHAGHVMNEKADELARAAATAHRDGTAVPHGPGFSGAEPAAALDVSVGQCDPDPDLFSIDVADEPVSAPAASGVVAPQGDGADNDHPLQAVLGDLTRRLLDDQTRTSSSALDELLHPEVIRHDSAGKTHTRRRLVSGLGRLERRATVDVIGVEELAPHTVLLRWRLGLGSRAHLVASIWQQVDGQWRLRFEQATPIS